MSINYLASVSKLAGRENYDKWAFAIDVFVLDGLSKCLGDTEKLNKAKAKLLLSIDLVYMCTCGM